MKKLSALLMMFFAFLAVAAQNANLVKRTPALPSSSGVSKFGDIPVDLHTGIATVSISLVTVSIPGLTVPISINYHGGGIKTEDVASNVGLGWSLSAGGQVSKMVVKYPDEGFSLPYQLADTVVTIEDGFGNRMSRSTRNTKNFRYINDLPDIYKVSAPGLSCRFSELVVQSPRERIVVNRLPDESLLLINTEGVKYLFGGSISASNSQAAIEDSSTYHLTKIELPGGQQVIFEYERTDLKIFRSSGREVHYISSSPGVVKDMIDDGLAAAWKNGSVASTFRIARILFPGGRLEFLYENPRKDLSGASSLTGIRQVDITGAGIMRQTKEISLHQSYFESTSFDVRTNTAVAPDYRSLFYRLRLDSVFVNSSQPDVFRFSYNNTELPEQGSLSQDHWGFYNGSPNQGLVQPYSQLRDVGTVAERREYSSFSNRLCNDSLTQAGILKKITYPNGGTTAFEYELNSTAMQFLGYTSYSSVADRNAAFRQKSFPLQPGAAIGEDEIFFGTNFTVNSETAVNGVKGEYVDFTLTKGAVNDNIPIPFKIVPLAAGTVNTQAAVLDTLILFQAGDVSVARSITRFLPNGVYRVMAAKKHQVFVGDGFAGNVMAPVTLSFHSGRSVKGDRLLTGSAGQHPAGGLRIKKITTYDGIDHAKDIVKYYKYHVPGDPNTSSGSFGVLPEYREETATLSAPDYLYPIIVGTRLERKLFVNAYWKIVVEETGDPEEPYKERKVFIVDARDGVAEAPEYAVTLAYDLFGFNVKMANSNKTAVKPVESYVGYSNVTVEYGENAAGGKTEFTYYNNGPDWQRGLLVKERNYRKEGNTFFPVTETVNDYAFNNDWYYLNGNTSKEYSQLDTARFLQSLTAYNYDNAYLPVPSRITTVTSAGDTTVSENRIVADFPGITQMDNISAGIRQLFDKNMLSIPVEKISYHKTAGGRGGLSSVFTAYSNSIPFPATIFSSGMIGGGTAFTPAGVVSGAVVKSGLYKPEVQFTQYDNSGNLLEQQKENSIPNAFIWGYNNRYIVAEIVNAKHGQVFYESFEEGTGQFDQHAKAGAYSHLGNYTVSFAPASQPPTSMRVTYWAFRNNTWVFESSAYSAGMILTGDRIDEVRIFPERARLLTYTYKPGMGILSKCDANNQYQYFEYNVEGKMIAVRNNNKDLIQTIQYQPQIDAINY